MIHSGSTEQTGTQVHLQVPVCFVERDHDSGRNTVDHNYQQLSQAKRHDEF